jgi:hypothetical protein
MTSKKHISEYAVSPELSELAREVTKSIPANVVSRYLRSFEIFPGDSETDVVERIKHIFDQGGISYTYSYYTFRINGDPAIQVNVLRNEGPHIRTRYPYSLNTIPLPEDKVSYIVELEDLSRKYGGVLQYLVKNYTAESISKFSLDNYMCLYTSY